MNFEHRTDGLLVEELADELVIYDTVADVATRLNETAALVWQQCDGEHSIDDLVALLQDQISPLADRDLVQVTLDSLADHGLLEGVGAPDPELTRTSRRRFIRRAGTVGAAALVLPVVQAVAAPVAAASDSSTCSTSTFACTTCNTSCTACTACT